MVDRIAFGLIAFSLSAVGTVFLSGQGYYSSKHGILFDFGENNIWVGVGLVLFPIIVRELGQPARTRY